MYSRMSSGTRIVQVRVTRRETLKRALALFQEAGWEVQDGVMRNVETGMAVYP